MAFWRELEKNSPAALDELPPLTDAMVAACEKKFGVKFPPRLLKLLRTKNGGFLEDRDFKFQGKDFRVSEIMGIRDGEKPSDIRPCSSFLDSPDLDLLNWRNQLQKQAGDPSKLLIFGEDHPCSYVLDYNHLNSVGEPKILCVLMDEDTVRAWLVVDSFDEFLKGQYSGDPEPTVRLEEAEKLKLVAEGGYTGKLKATGAGVKISWKICSQRNRFIVFQDENWGSGVKLVRSELRKAHLCLDDPPRLLEEYGVDIEPDLAKLIRGQVEAPCIEEYDVGTKPRCYVFRLEVLVRKSSVLQQTSRFFNGKWKNSSGEIAYASVYSDAKSKLEKARQAAVQDCSGLKRFFG